MSILKIKDSQGNWVEVQTIKGKKGDPFTYADFTPEQLESLKGKDGISPTVSVASDTSEDYRLSFTDETHTVTTPNLIPEAEKIFDVYPTDTASGAVASFPDGADDIPLKSCIVQVEPVQDLHGYDSPWSAGGGVNKWNFAHPVSSINASVTENADGTFSVVGSSESAKLFYLVSVKPNQIYSIRLAKSNESGNTSVFGYGTIYDGNDDTAAVLINSLNFISGKTFTPTGDYVYIAFQVTGGSSSGSATASGPIINEGSTTATFVPYENICPISGFTGVEVQRTGKNLFDKSDTSKQMFNVYIGNNKLVTGANRCVCFILCKPNMPYVFSRKAVKTNERFVIGYTEEYPEVGVDVYEVKFATSSQTIGNMMSLTLTTGANAKYLVVWAYWDNTIEALDTLQIEVGNTASDIESYQGNTYPITFPSEAGTIYGAHVDVINGELVVDRAQIASYNGETLPSTWISDRDVYASGTTPTIGAQVVYKLAEPIRYPLTPNQINSLYGQNNLWADTGDTEVKYRANTTLYIQRLTEPDTDMVADANIVSGQYFMVGNNLYRATVNIASGAQVIDGANATKVSLSEALNQIKEA